MKYTYILALCLFICACKKDEPTPNIKNKSISNPDSGVDSTKKREQLSEAARSGDILSKPNTIILDSSLKIKGLNPLILTQYGEKITVPVTVYRDHGGPVAVTVSLKESMPMRSAASISATSGTTPFTFNLTVEHHLAADFSSHWSAHAQNNRTDSITIAAYSATDSVKVTSSANLTGVDNKVFAQRLYDLHNNHPDKTLYFKHYTSTQFLGTPSSAKMHVYYPPSGIRPTVYFTNFPVGYGYTTIGTTAAPLDNPMSTSHRPNFCEMDFSRGKPQKCKATNGIDTLEFDIFGSLYAYLPADNHDTLFIFDYYAGSSKHAMENYHLNGKLKH